MEHYKFSGTPRSPMQERGRRWFLQKIHTLRRGNKETPIRRRKSADYEKSSTSKESLLSFHK